MFLWFLTKVILAYKCAPLVNSACDQIALNLVPNFKNFKTNECIYNINSSIINIVSASLIIICSRCVCILYLRECPFQPAASRADDLTQRTEHLTQEVLHRRDQHKLNTTPVHNAVQLYTCNIDISALFIYFFILSKE